MKYILSIMALTASLALFSCDTGESNSYFDQDTGEDTCDQEMIDNITLISTLCSSEAYRTSKGYGDYAECKAYESDRVLTLFLICKLDDDGTDEEK